MNSIWL